MPYLGVPLHAVKADELDVQAPQRQAVLRLADPGLLVERLVLVSDLEKLQEEGGRAQ